jgi:hypothetical protein
VRPVTDGDGEHDKKDGFVEGAAKPRQAALRTALLLMRQSNSILGIRSSKASPSGPVVRRKD